MTNSPRVVIDTNVLISAVLSKKGPPNKVVDTVLEHGILLASEATFRELETRIRRAKFARYLAAGEREAYLEILESASHFIDITERIVQCRDPKDDKFLELAVNGGAEVIISGDDDLKVLHPFRGIPILKPAEFLESEFVQGSGGQ